eukprot:gene4123-4519_t
MGLFVGVLTALLIVRFVWRKVRSPSRPLLTVFLDTLCDLPHFFSLGPWSRPADIINAVSSAIKETNLTDFGQEEGQEGEVNDFIQRYDATRKYGLANSHARYSPAGYLIIQQVFVKKMKERLQLIDYIKHHPSINNIKLKPPVFVIGLTRTGTTFLHEKLGLHESVRVHSTWEQFVPIPTTNDEDIQAQEKDRQQRYQQNRSKFDLLFKHIVSEKIQYIHRIGYDEPEECTVPCSYGLPWAITELPFHIFAAEETFPMGAGKAFDLYRKILQLFTWQSADRRDKDFTWMLKCPFHLPYLEELIESFPGATIVWTHRDPAQCIASACSLFQTLMEMGMEEDSIDPILIGKAIMKYSKLCLAKAEASLEKLKGKIKIVHVRYEDNVKKSKDVCKRIFETAEIPFTSTYEEKLDAYLHENELERQRMKAKKGQTAMHDYKPEEYGLTAQLIREEFKDYIAKYNL